MTREQVVFLVLVALTLWLLHNRHEELVLTPLKGSGVLSTPRPFIAASDLETRWSRWGQQRPRSLLYCGGIKGRFSNQVMCANKMLWLAATTNRTLVLSPIYGTFPTALYDPAAIAAYLRPSGGYLLSDELRTCSVVPHVYSSSRTPNKGAMMSLGDPECSDRCSFAGAQSVVQFDDPNAELADVAAMTVTDNACFFLPVPADQFPVMPFHPDVRRQAAAVWDDIESIIRDQESGSSVGHTTLCAHVRREDLALVQPPLEQVVSEIMAAVTANGVRKLYVSHNANETELAFLVRSLPTGTQFKCDPKRWPGCGLKSDGWQRLITEHAICSQADFFVGSAKSSFTGMIAAQRHKVLKKNPHTSVLIGQKPDISWPYLTLKHYKIKNGSYV